MIQDFSTVWLWMQENVSRIHTYSGVARIFKGETKKILQNPSNFEHS